MIAEYLHLHTCHNLARAQPDMLERMMPLLKTSSCDRPCISILAYHRKHENILCQRRCLMSVYHFIYGPTHAGTMVAAQYLACLFDIPACLSGSQEVAELAHRTDT